MRIIKRHAKGKDFFHNLIANLCAGIDDFRIQVFVIHLHIAQFFHAHQIAHKSVQASAVQRKRNIARSISRTRRFQRFHRDALFAILQAGDVVFFPSLPIRERSADFRRNADDARLHPHNQAVSIALDDGSIRFARNLLLFKRRKKVYISAQARIPVEIKAQFLHDFVVRRRIVVISIALRLRNMPFPRPLFQRFVPISKRHHRHAIHRLIVQDGFYSFPIRHTHSSKPLIAPHPPWPE